MRIKAFDLDLFRRITVWKQNPEIIGIRIENIDIFVPTKLKSKIELRAKVYSR